MSVNRLKGASSPYLRQHADQPVAWQPWGEAAFAEARRRDCPVFLSIGYASCHWCHVMAEESFADPEVARLLNEAFVPVKVDREERPDVDAVYMSACQLLTGSGGWPLTAVLTPEGRPFFAGTYFPKESGPGRIGLLELLPKLERIWRTRREQVVEAAAEIVEALRRAVAAGGGAGALEETVLERAVAELTARFDAVHGGFGGAPKFPTPHVLSFLLRYGRRRDEPRPLELVETTLVALRRGGIFDQIGHGFHRYATDAAWQLPHFEKMLPDQALLALAYLEAFQLTGKAFYARVAREVLDYVLRELAAPEGGFYASQDADSEGEEGAYYLWTLEEVRAALPPEQAERAARAFDVRPEGNYFEEVSGRRTGRNVLRLACGLEELDELEPLRRALQAARSRRPPPARDEKVLTDWNGLMIAALARGAAVWDEPAYAQAASRTAARLLGSRPAAELLHCEGVPALLDDFACLIWGLIELYEATFQSAHLRAAVALAEVALERFWDATDGGFFLVAAGADADLPARPKPFYDGAWPSGNGVMALDLVRLGRLTGQRRWSEWAERLLAAFASEAARAPAAATALLSALEASLSEPLQVVIAGELDRPRTRALIRAARAAWPPERALLHRPADETDPIFELVPFLRAQTAPPGRARAYLCREGACEAPYDEPQALGERLGAHAGPPAP